MPPFVPVLPLEIIIKISEILYMQECFLELESILYTFPQLQEQFNYRIPTIVAVDTDQYDKYKKFIHTRERPFGSEDLLIIKQEKDHETGRISKHNSMCYMVLSSKCNQKLVPRAFKQLKHYLTLRENKALLGGNSFKCYDIIFHREINREKFQRFRKNTTNPCECPAHVGLILKTFLEPIDPKMVRFEMYSDNYDLSFDFLDTFYMFDSLCDFGLPRESANTTSRSYEDGIITIPKCSFEFIKDTEDLTSLYQYSLWNGKRSYDARADGSLNSTSLTKGLWHWLFGNDEVVNIGLFLNLKNVTIDQVAPNSRESNYISVDCSKSAIKSKRLYEFMLNNKRYLIKKVCRSETGARGLELREEEINPDDEAKAYAERKPPPHYIEIFYRNFLTDKLQSADITAFNSSYSHRRCIPNQTKEISNLTELNLTDLENEINLLLSFMKDLNKINETDEEISDQEKILGLSQKIMSTISYGILNSHGTCERLIRDQPFRLRVFNIRSHMINRADQIHKNHSWFRSFMCCKALDQYLFAGVETE